MLVLGFASPDPLQEQGEGKLERGTEAPRALRRNSALPDRGWFSSSFYGVSGSADFPGSSILLLFHIQDRSNIRGNLMENKQNFSLIWRQGI